MSYSISTLLTRNLQDVFGENDPSLRRAAIDEMWTEDGVFYDPKTGVHRGRDEIDRIAGAIRATHPDFRYQPIAEPEEVGDGGRIRWVSGPPGEAPGYAGVSGAAAAVAEPQRPPLLGDERQVVRQVLDRAVDHLSHAPVSPVAHDAGPLPRLGGRGRQDARDL